MHTPFLLYFDTHYSICEIITFLLFGVPKVLSEGINKIFREKNFIGVSTKSWEKSRIFRYGLPKVFLSKGQKTPGGVQRPPTPID